MATDYEAILEDAATAGVQSVTSDGQTVSAHSLSDQIKLADRAAAKAAVAAPGGAWGRVVRSRALANGAGPDARSRGSISQTGDFV